MPKVTIADIALRAGVSKTAVSFAFNNPGRISQATRARILQIAEELGYSPHPTASNLKTGRTGAIGLLLPQPIAIVARNPHNWALIEGIGVTCEAKQLSLMLVPPLNGNLRRAIRRAAVDGFLTYGLRPHGKTMTVLNQRGAPFVMLDSELLEGVPCVNIDDAGGMYAAMHHIVAQGHRDILILGILTDKGGHYQEYTGSLRRRIQGSLAALHEFGLDIDGQRVRLVESAVDVESGEATFAAVWERGFRPTAVVTMADVLAIGVIHAARNLGLSIPTDLSVTGFDDIPSAQLLQPALTTVHQPIAEKGQLAAEVLLACIDSPSATRNIYHELPVQLIERHSTRLLSPETGSRA